MKKRFILFFLISCFMLNAGYSNALEIKSSDIVFVKSDEKETNIQTETIMETDNISIIKKNDKLGIFDKKSNAFIIEPIIDEISHWNDSEWKLRVSGLTGYINIDNHVNFITNYDDLFLLKKYIKTKKDNKYGLIDKNGNLILKPVYQKVGIVNTDTAEYISGKIDGKYKLFYNTGKLIPEEDLYKFGDDEDYALAKDLRPEFKKYKENNSVVYKKIEQKPIVSEKYVYEVQDIEVPENTRFAGIEKNITNTNIKTIENSNVNRELLNVENDILVLITDKNKYGLKDKKEKEILPAIYNNLIIKKPCEHFSKPIILAERNNAYSIYDVKGKLLAEQVYDKINIYKRGKIYTYTKEDNQFVLRCNGKRIGNLAIDGNEYKFTKTRFTLFNPHKINEMLISLLTIA